MTDRITHEQAEQAVSVLHDKMPFGTSEPLTLLRYVAQQREREAADELVREGALRLTMHPNGAIVDESGRMVVRVVYGTVEVNETILRALEAKVGK